MSSSKFPLGVMVIVLLLGLGVGFGAGYFFGDGGNDHNIAREVKAPRTDRNTQQVQAPTPKEGPSDPPASASPRVQPATEPKPDPSDRSTQGRPVDERVRLALESLPPIEQVRGSGVISGTVLDSATGKPIQGVLIQAYGTKRGQSRSGARTVERLNSIKEEPDIVKAALDVVELERERHSRYYHTETAHDGSYSLGGLADDALYSIEARMRGYLFSTRPQAGSPAAQTSNVPPGAVVHFHGRRRNVIEYRVLMPDGSDAIGARIHTSERIFVDSLELAKKLEPKFGSGQGMPFNGSGSWMSLDTGFYALHATHSTDEGGFKSDVVYVGPPETGTTSVTLQLQLVRGVSLFVVDDHNTMYRNGQVIAHLLPWQSDTPPTASQIPRSYEGAPGHEDHQFHRVPLQSSAPISFLEPTLGRHVMVLRRSEAILAHAFIDIREGHQTVTLTLPSPVRSEYAVVWVMGPDGKPLTTGFDIAIAVNHRFPRDHKTNVAKPLPDGSWQILFSYHEAQSRRGDDDQLVLVVDHPEFGQKTAYATRSELTEVTIAFEGAATIEVILDGIQGHPVQSKSDLWIRRKENLVTSRPMGHPTMTANGFIATPFQPGTYTLLAFHHVENGVIAELASTTAEIKPGRNVIRLPMAQLFSVRVNVPSTPEGTKVSLEREVEHVDGSGRQVKSYTRAGSGWTDGDKGASFQHLVAGKYRASVQTTNNLNFDTFEFNLPGPSSILLVPR